MPGFNKFKQNSFFLSQLIYSLLIISLCTFIVGVFSYNLIKKDTTNRVIESNNEILYQYRNTIDSFVFSDFSIMSLRLLQDIKNIPELEFYLDNTLIGNITGILTVHDYLNRFKSLNPLICSVTVYYKYNKLAVTTDYIRYSLSDSSDDNVVLYYDNLLQSMTEKSANNISFVYEKGSNMYKEMFVSGKLIPDNVINVVRLLPGLDGASGVVVISINADALHKMIMKYAPDGLNSIMIVDEAGKIVLHTDMQNTGKYVYDTLQADNAISLDGESGNIVANIGSVRSVLSYQTSELKKWKYIALTPMLIINGATEYIYKTIICVSLFSLILCLIISLFAAKYLSRPIKKIAVQCSKIAYVKSPLIKNEYSLISGTLDNLAQVMRQKEIEMDEISLMLRVNFVAWLLSDNAPSETDIQRKIEVLRIKFEYSRFCVIAFELKRKTYIDIENTNDTIGYEFEKVRTRLFIEKALNTEFSQCTLYEKDEVIMAFINFDCELDKLVQICINSLEEFSENFSCYTAVSIASTDLNKVVEMSKQALSCLGYSYIYPDKFIFSYLEIINYGSNSFSIRISFNNFVNSLKGYEYEKCIEDFHIMMDDIKKGNYCLEYVKNTLLLIANEVDSIACNKDSNMKLVNHINKVSNINEFAALAEGIIKIELTKKLNKETNVLKELVDNAKVYIDKNIMNTQFSLDTVAREMGVSPNYLSKIFHSECEMTYVDYVANLKMQHSRRLLLETNMTIEEVSHQLGYSTPQYFISKFKKHFGCTPNFYRRKSKVGSA